MHVTVIGAGGIGSYYGGLLARAGHAVTLVARGAHLGALRAGTLTVRTPDAEFGAPVRAIGVDAEPGAADLVLVAVKSYDLPAVTPLVGRLTAAGALAIPFLNGVDALPFLAASGVEESRLLGGIAHVSAVRVRPGVVERRSAYDQVVVGEPAGGLSSRALAMADVFRTAGAEARASASIEVELWRKFIFIAAVAAACGLARRAIGAVRAAPCGPQLLERLVTETAAVGRAAGVALGPDEEATTLKLIGDLPDAMRPSLLLDLLAERRTEVEALSGAVVRRARALGLDAPAHETAFAALSATTA
jgi:2-dehydropantoate 2-reductase